MTRKRTPRELRAMAYALADEVETRADRIQRERPRLTYAQCQSAALLEMLAD
jgi:hypothetical protein